MDQIESCSCRARPKVQFYNGGEFFFPASPEAVSPATPSPSSSGGEKNGRPLLCDIISDTGNDNGGQVLEVARSKSEEGRAPREPLRLAT